MKKIQLWCLLLPLICLVTTVKAETATLQEEYLKEVYYVLKYQDGTTHTHQEAKFTMNGKTVYCLNPRNDALPGEYTIENGIPENILDQELQKQVEEYGYYGYDYPGHQTINYYLATQELIWEAVEEVEVSWHTRNYEHGDVIDIEAEKEEIKNLIQHAKVKPSFIEEAIEAPFKEDIILEDTNQVLSNYEVIEGGVIQNNHLIIPKIDKVEMQTILLQRKKYDYETTLTYQKEGSQTLSFLRISDTENLTYQIKRTGGMIPIHKTGENPVIQNNQYQYEFIPLKNVEFEIYAAEDIKGYQHTLYQKNQLVTTVTTNEKGDAVTDILPLGKYYIKEKNTLENYIPNNQKYQVTVKEMNDVIEIQNQRQKGYIKIKKIGPDHENIPGTEFELYNEKGILVGKNTTNEKGILIFENLPYGNYILKETKTDEKYKNLENNVSVTINQKENFITIVNQKKEELPNTSNTNHPGNLLINYIPLCLLYCLWKKL